jgi:polyferredoxin
MRDPGLTLARMSRTCFIDTNRTPSTQCKYFVLTLFRILNVSAPISRSIESFVCQLYRWGYMNPLGIVQAVIALFEAADPKRQKETEKQERRFLLLYFAIVLFGIAVVVWVVRSLYFSK